MAEYTMVSKQKQQEFLLRIAAAHWHEFCKINLSKIRVLSLAKHGALNNHLLWSHYADAHQGFAFGFSYETFPDGQVHDVVYSEIYRPLDFFHDDESILFKGFDRVLTTKSKSWEYECEARVLTGAQCKGPLKFEKRMLAEVVFGCKCTLSHIKTVVNLCSAEGIYPKYKQACIKENSFEINIKELSLDADCFSI